MLQQSLRRAMRPRRQSICRRWCSAQDLQLHILSARLLSSPLKGQPRRGWFPRWTGQGQTSWRTGWNLGRLRWFRWLVMLHPFAYSMLMFGFLHEHNYVIGFQIRGPLNSIRLLTAPATVQSNPHAGDDVQHKIWLFFYVHFIPIVPFVWHSMHSSQEMLLCVISRNCFLFYNLSLSYLFNVFFDMKTMALANYS